MAMEEVEVMLSLDESQEPENVGDIISQPTRKSFP